MNEKIVYVWGDKAKTPSVAKTIKEEILPKDYVLVLDKAPDGKHMPVHPDERNLFL